MNVSAHWWVLGLAFIAASGPLPGVQLPLRHYTTADGLANNTVLGIAPDSRGFLWFATAEGLSRFDGYGFANQTKGTGLPHRIVRQVLIGRHGNYWLATPAGLVRFRPHLPASSADRMLVIRPDGKPEAAHIEALLEDRFGNTRSSRLRSIICLSSFGIVLLPVNSPNEIGAAPSTVR